MVSLLGLDPETYAPSALHHPDRTFPRNQLLRRLWIELLHALGIDAATAMAFACTVDFEGDQWTFFKPPPDELERLYGIDVHEMQLYRPTIDHVVEQLTGRQNDHHRSRLVLYAGSSRDIYRHGEHVKSSIAIEAIDPAARTPALFSWARLLRALGEDYRGIFPLGARVFRRCIAALYRTGPFRCGPPAEGRGPSASGARNARPATWPETAAQSMVDVRRAPFRIFRRCSAGTDAEYHAYAFATVRQCGAAFETPRSFVEWLAPASFARGEAAAAALGRQVNGAKSSSFQACAAAGLRSWRRRFEQLADDWEIAMHALDCLAFGARRGAA